MDVISRWRDAITDPPPDGWRGLVSRDRRHEIVRWAYYDDSYKCFRDERHDQIDSAAYWLDVTDERRKDIERAAMIKALKWVGDNIVNSSEVRQAICRLLEGGKL